MKIWLAAALASALAASVTAQQAPQFRSGVERVVIDVQVVDRQGRPIEALGPDDFEVKVDNQIRKVVSAEFIRAVAIDTAAAGAPLSKSTGTAVAPIVPAGGGRDFILAIDEASFQTRYAPAAVRAARGFVDRLAPGDRVGLYPYPVSKRSFIMTTDHAAILKELDGIIGTQELPVTRFHLSKSEVIDIEAGDSRVLAQVAARECSRSDFGCKGQISGEAHALAMDFETDVSQSMGGLHPLFNALRQDPERKTVVIVSGGLLASDRIGGRPDVSAVITQVGEDAARANATIYVLHMDSSFLEAFSAANGAGARSSLMREQDASEGGLDRLAGTAGGTLVHVEPGSEDRAFDRILRETSAYYLVSVEPLDQDRDGRPHYISVKTTATGADVRSRKTVVIPPKLAAAARPAPASGRPVRSPRPASSWE